MAGDKHYNAYQQYCWRLATSQSFYETSSILSDPCTVGASKTWTAQSYIFGSETFSNQQNLSTFPTVSGMVKNRNDGEETRSLQEKWLMLETRRKLDQSFLDGFTKTRIKAGNNHSSEEDKVQIFEVQTINANNQSKNLQIPITNKRVKRALNKQRKKRQKQELEEILQAREELHKRIDHNLKVQQLHQDRDFRNFPKNSNSRGRICRKEEIEKLEKLILSIKQLRDLRERSYQSRYGLRPSKKNSSYFQNVMGLLDKVLQKQTAIAENVEEENQVI